MPGATGRTSQWKRIVGLGGRRDTSWSCNFSLSEHCFDQCLRVYIDIALISACESPYRLLGKGIMSVKSYARISLTTVLHSFLSLPMWSWCGTNCNDTVASSIIRLVLDSVTVEA